VNRLVLVLGLLAGTLPGCGPKDPPTGEGPRGEGPRPSEKPPLSSPGEELAGPVWFADVTARSGLSFTYRNGQEAGRFSILESLGGGVGLLDYDRDGLLDVFVTGGGGFGGPDAKQLFGYPCKLYRNRGHFRFEDVTADVGLERTNWWYTHGVAVTDFDRDGWPDLLVTGYGRVALFHNRGNGSGGRLFVDVTAAVGLHDPQWSTSAAWADLDGDGFPDLYVCHYCDWSNDNDPVCYAAGQKGVRDICPPQRFRGLRHAVFRNEKGQTFREVSAEVGARFRGRGLGVIFVDLNEDGRPDAYVGNDLDYNFLYFNRGGTLEEKGLLVGVAGNERGVPEGSMGVDAGDFDGSGRPSLFVTNFQNEWHGLYRNLGQEMFNYQSRTAGIGAIGQSFDGFGTAFVDVDGDGWEDLVVVNGHAMRNPVLGSSYEQRPVLFHNRNRDGRRYFVAANQRGGPYFQKPALGRGLVVGDLDNDGRPDLVVSHTNSPVAVLRNVANEGDARAWIGLQLVGRGKRDVVGSTVTVATADRKLTRFTKGGGSYLSASDPRILLSLASEAPVKVTVRWAWGETQVWDGLQPGSYWELREGDPVARPATVARPAAVTDRPAS